MRSDNVTKGSERAPNRSLFYALGYTPEELDRPLIGVVSAYSEIVPGHMNLDKIADAVKAGVQMAGGTPILIPAIGVCDGIAMGHVGMKYSLASRELICDSVETMLMAHQLDGLVLVPNCATCKYVSCNSSWTTILGLRTDWRNMFTLVDNGINNDFQYDTSVIA